MAVVYSPPQITKKIIVAFASLFDKIEIVSRDRGRVLLPIWTSTRERLFSIAHSTSEERNRYRFSLPLLGFSLNSMSFDQERAQTQLNTISSQSINERVRQPVPYNFSVELYALMNRASELFELMEIILPMYQQARYFPFVEYKFQDSTMMKRDIPIILDSNSFEIKGELADADEQVFSTTLTFTIKAYLHNAFIAMDDSLIGPWGPQGTKDGWVVSNGPLGPIQFISIDYEEYVQSQYEKLLLNQHITEDTGGNIVVTTTSYEH